MRNFSLLVARGGIGELVSWFIRIVIYDICITGIMSIFGVSRLVALVIFFSILAVIAFGGYIIRQRVASSFED